MMNGHVDDLVDAYALGALEPDEVDAVERHLETCSACRALAQDARRNAESLWLTTPQVAPPASLRNRVLARIAQEKAATGIGAAVDSANSAPARDEHAREPDSDTAPEPAPPARGAFRRLTQALWGEQATDERAASALLRDLLADPQSIVWPVAGTPEAPQASARFVVSRNRRDGVIVTNGLRRPGAGKAYQVWLLRGGQPLPNALFLVNRSGVGASIVHADEPWRDFDTVAVTPEPMGGSPAPSGPIVLAGSLVERAG
ncbi:MAG TPA: anti-sigma factor [Ktedonobacterales bacterium]|jgi:anti-sigma-K factor RskA|nr:anti-sigma factor [Ktedonobacterales bacterium]